jgi:mono/diheme cytochrome c family protein
LFTAGVVSYFGVQGSGRVEEAGKETAAEPGPVVAISLPVADPVVPPGPHREQFVTSCSVCHSPRLVFTQPHLSEKQWTATVTKMVAIYGAPITPAQEKEIVTYLSSVPGQQEMR